VTPAHVCVRAKKNKKKAIIINDSQLVPDVTTKLTRSSLTSGF